MTFMKLAPEIVRLRRLARAHAAGELSEEDYRAVRREVIDTFAPGPPDADETRPRWRPEPTLRRNEHEAAHAIPGVALGARAASRRWLWWLAALLALALGIAGLPRAASADPRADVIPPVSQRDPNPASSPRLTVTHVRVELPADERAGLDPEILADLQGLADEELRAARDRDRPAEHGFSAAELEEIGRLLNAFGVHEGGAVDAADARDLATLIRDQKRRRGVSVAELERMAVVVQNRLRQHGYFLAQAYVPSQRLEDGEATIAVLPGRLGDVRVDGGDPALVTRAFADLLGEPLVLADVSRRLLALNALPGFDAQASFGPGERVGETRLHLDVRNQRRWLASVAIDNHGDEATGDQRIAASASWLNPRHVGDRLSAGVLAGIDPANQTFGYLAYETPLGGAYHLEARLGNNAFRWDGSGAASADSSGDAHAVVLDLGARRVLEQSRRYGMALGLDGAVHRLGYDDGLDQTASMLGGRLSGHRVWDAVRIALDADLHLTTGHLSGDRFAGQREDFWLIGADAFAWLPVDLPLLGGEQKLSLRLQGQFSDARLPATRRFALGGAHRARGFDRDGYLADRAALIGLDLRVPVTLGEFVLFADAGYGESLTGGARTWAHVADAGLGWEAELQPRLSSRVRWALPLTARGSDDLDDDGARLYWSLRYDY